MAKSRNSALFKQQSIIDNAFRIAKRSRNEEKYGKDNLTVSEQLILEMNERKAKEKLQPKKEVIRYSPKYCAINGINPSIFKNK